MVEMALSMIILLTILFGLIEMCLALYTYHFVSDAAREGSRYAIVHGSTCLVSGAVVHCHSRSNSDVRSESRISGHQSVRHDGDNGIFGVACRRHVQCAGHAMGPEIWPR